MKKPFNPSVTVYVRVNGEIYILADSLLKGLVGVESDPFFSHTVNDDANDLGNSVLKAKAGSLSYLIRENHLAYIPPYFEWAGVSSYAQFAKNTKMIQISFIDDQVTFSPRENKRGTWYGSIDKTVSLANSVTAKQLGEQLLLSAEDAIA